MAITPRQLRFVQEYQADLNATQAAIRAGYSAKTAEQIGSRLLRTPAVKAAIEAKAQKVADKLDLKAEDVLRELMRVGLSDLGELFDENNSLRPIREMPLEVRRAISGIEVDELWGVTADGKAQIGVTKKIKLWNKNEALVTLAKHLRLLTDKVEVTGNDAGPLRIVVEQLPPEAAE